MNDEFDSEKQAPKETSEKSSKISLDTEQRINLIEQKLENFASRNPTSAPKRLLSDRIKEIDGFLLIIFLIITLLLTWDANRRSRIVADAIASHRAIDTVLDTTLNVNIKIRESTLPLSSSADISAQMSTLRHRVASGAYRIVAADHCMQRLVTHVDLLSRGDVTAHDRNRISIDRDALIFDLSVKLRERLDYWEARKAVPILGFFRQPQAFEGDFCFAPLSTE